MQTCEHDGAIVVYTTHCPICRLTEKTAALAQRFRSEQGYVERAIDGLDGEIEDINSDDALPDTSNVRSNLEDLVGVGEELIGLLESVS